MRQMSTRRSFRSAAVALGALVALGGPSGAAVAHSLTPASAVTASADAASMQQRKLVKTQRLFDGSVAKIYKVGDRYEANIFFHGKKIATMSSRTTVFRHHGVNYSFHPYKGSVWAEKGKPRPGEPINPAPDPTPDDVVPPVPAPDPTPDDVVSPVPNPAPDQPDTDDSADSAPLPTDN
ncbi:hypothetical protein ABZX75_33475 [Streptomyces sp. NPDC003038]|uniref:hypothetical protein n=1 Tax=unclassified Streptomyces TaxID=2593676 RepID=UPI0033B0EEC8